MQPNQATENNLQSKLINVFTAWHDAELLLSTTTQDPTGSGVIRLYGLVFRKYVT